MTTATISNTGQSLLNQFLSLPVDERKKIFDVMADSMDQDDVYDDELDEEFMKEVNRRSDEIDAGTAKGRDAEEVLTELKARFG